MAYVLGSGKSKKSGSGFRIPDKPNGHSGPDLDKSGKIRNPEKYGVQIVRIQTRIPDFFKNLKFGNKCQRKSIIMNENFF
jgi:hypothetical protein